MSTQNNDSTVHLVFHSDPSHGWAQVPHSLIWELHLQTLISNYSYVDETYSYLEEDCDLAVLAQALRERGLGLSFSEKRVNGASRSERNTATPSVSCRLPRHTWT